MDNFINLSQLAGAAAVACSDLLGHTPQPPSLPKGETKRERGQYNRPGKKPSGIKNSLGLTIHSTRGANANERQSPVTALGREERQNQADPEASLNE